MKPPVTHASRTWATLTIGLFASQSCETHDGHAGHTAHDSAGVRIIESHTPHWKPGEEWVLEPTPFLTIGTVHGEPQELLDRVMGVVVLDDGSVAVANMGDNTVRYYDPDGRLRFRRGGTGGGPEEFRQIMGLDRVGDEIIAQQGGSLPSKVFGRNGAFIRAVPSAWDQIRGASLVGFCDSDTALLRARPQARDAPPGVSVQNMELYVYAAAVHDSVQHILSLPAARFVPGPRQRARFQEFGPLGVVTTSSHHIYYAWTEEYDIRVFDRAGRLLRRIRRAWSPVPVTDDHIEAYRRFMLEGRTESGGPPQGVLLEQRRATFEHMLFPTHHRALAMLRPDRAGNLWVMPLETPNLERYTQASFTPVSSEPTRWDVFDTTGVWLGTVQTPARFVAFEGGDDYVAGVWKDALDVEYVHVYRLVKPEPIPM